MTATTPCSEDYAGSKRDWTSGELTREEAMELARLCATCPLRQKCLEDAEAESPNTEGIWGGWLWRPGVRKAVRIDPLGIERGEMRSIYKWVLWSRGKWRVYKDRTWHGAFDSEDEAGAVARRLAEADGDG